MAVENYGGIGSLQQIIYQKFTLTDLRTVANPPILYFSVKMFLDSNPPKFPAATTKVLCYVNRNVTSTGRPIIHVACFIKHAWKLQCNMHSIMNRPEKHVRLKTFKMDYYSEKHIILHLI